MPICFRLGTEASSPYISRFGDEPSGSESGRMIDDEAVVPQRLT